MEYETDKRHYAHVDCPGHADYVKNMITGSRGNILDNFNQMTGENYIEIFKTNESLKDFSASLLVGTQDDTASIRLENDMATSRY